MSEPEPTVLGTLDPTASDATLDGSATTPPLQISRRRQREASEDPARLPKGAWLRLRAAGGIVFRSSETAVFDDGRLTYRSSPSAVYGQTLLARELTETQMSELRAALQPIDLESITAAANHGRDTMAFELTVRNGRKTRMVEVFQGTVPAMLAPVFDMLGELVRVGADELRG